MPFSGLAVSEFHLFRNMFPIHYKLWKTMTFTKEYHVFRVCGNYVLMRVVHCGVLAARAPYSYGSYMRWEVACTLRVSIKILRTRDHKEGCI